MQDTCHMNFVMNLAHRGVSQFSGGASERGIRSSEVRFYMGTRNFFPLSRAHDKTTKTSFSITELKTYHFSYFHQQSLRYRHC